MIGDVLAQTLPFFAILFAGFALAKLKVVGPAAVAGINTYVFYLALPALLIQALATRPLAEIARGDFLIVYIALLAALFALGLIAQRWLTRDGWGASAVASMGGCYSNIGFMGLPLAVALMGPEAALPIVLILLVDLTLLMGAVVVLLELDRGGGDGSPAKALAQVLKGLATNPLILAITAGLLWSASGFGVPGGVTVLFDLLVPTAGPPALFAIGAALAQRKLAARAAAPLAWLTVSKLAVHPVLVFFALLWFAPDLPPVWLAAATLAAAMPAAGNIFVLADRYGRFATEISAAILITTLLAVASVPVAVWLLEGQVAG